MNKQPDSSQKSSTHKKTIHESKKQKLQRIAWLIETFPNAFFKKDLKPLKIGIYEDLLAFYESLETPPFSKKALRETLNYYICSPAYLTACQQEHAARVDLYGNEVDVITADHARYAVQRYQEIHNKKAAKQTIPEDEA